MGEKEKLFLIVESQLINVEGMLEIDNHHLANTIVTFVEGGNHQWILKISGQKYDEKKQAICIVLKYLSTRYLLIIVGKRVALH